MDRFSSNVLVSTGAPAAGDFAIRVSITGIRSSVCNVLPRGIVRGVIGQCRNDRIQLVRVKQQQEEQHRHNHRRRLRIAQSTVVQARTVSWLAQWEKYG